MCELGNQDTFADITLNYIKVWNTRLNGKITKVKPPIKNEEVESKKRRPTLVYCDVLCNSSRVELDLAEIAAHYLTGDHNFCPNYCSHQASNWIKYVPICAY